MEELELLLQQMLNKDLEQIILSNSRDREKLEKVKIRPVMIKEQLLFQETRYVGTQVFHENYNQEEISLQIMDYLKENFKQGEFLTTLKTASVLVSKKGKITIKQRMKKIEDGAAGYISEGEKTTALSHNRQKKYILAEGKPVDFLMGLGVQAKDGSIFKAKYDKYRQINRYLEFVDDILQELPQKDIVRIIDFGCGKSYLTFAMYYYLHEIKHMNLEMIGLDLKTDVISHCNELATKLKYQGLHFERGDISSYQGACEVDMVVTLHACDVATDYAIEKAISWGARVIMAVPCCQHEVNKQIDCKELKPIMKYGVIKERMSALITDAIRANLLEENGYDTQILEFIDMEHTPKNLLIRAVKKNKMQVKRNGNNVDQVMKFLNINPTLDNLLQNRRDT